MVGEQTAIRVPAGLVWVEGQHIRKQRLGVDSGYSIFHGVISHVLQHVDKLVEEALPVVSGLTAIEFRFGLVGVEEVREGRVAGAVHRYRACRPYGC